jgi:NAD(P)-dependent dehydrogenase (short-subunit alcohol dehydrogenase family)
LLIPGVRPPISSPAPEAECGWTRLQAEDGGGVPPPRGTDQRRAGGWSLKPYPDPMHLRGRHILVTGGSAGIGRALVDAYRLEGASVLSVARHPTDPLVLEGDLTAPATRRRIVDALEGRPLDVVVHNAGALGSPATPLASYPEDVWRHVFEINVHAVQLLHASLVPHLAPFPTVIGVTSSVGRRGRAGWGAYSASKFALEGWLQVLASEWGSDGRVYSVNPGGTATPMRSVAFPGEDQDTLPSPRDITPLFLRLAHALALEPSGGYEARDWIGSDPWEGIPHT